MVSALLKLLDDTNGQRIRPEMDIRIPEPPKPASRPRPQQSSGNRYGDRNARFGARQPEKPYTRNSRPEGAKPYDRPYRENKGDKSRNWSDKAPRYGKPDHAKGRAQDRPVKQFFDPRRGKAPNITYPAAKKSHRDGGAEE